MTSEWSDAKIDYDAAGGERILAVHQFRSRVQNERERRSRKTVEWRRRVSMQYVPLHVLSSKSCISTPEIWAHDYVRMGRSVGTSAMKVKV